MSTRGSTGYSYYVPESRSSSHHDLTASDLSQEASSYMGRFGISATDGTRHFSVGDLQNSIRELEGLLQSFLALEVHGFLVPVYQEINKHCPGWNNGTSPSREQLNCQRSYLSALLVMTAQLHQTAQLYQGSRSTQTQMVGQTKREIQDIVKNLVTLTFNPDPRHADFTEESARSPLVGRTDSGYGSIASSILNSSARTNRTDRSASSLGCSSDSEDRVAKTSAMSSAGSENHQEPLKIKDLKQFWAYLDQMIKLVYIVIDRKIDLLSQVFSPPGVLDNWRRKRYESDRNKIYKLTCHDMEATRNWMNWLETRLECSSTPGDQPRGDCVEGSGIEGHVNRTKRYLAVMKNPGVPGERAYILRRPDPFNFDDSSVQAAVEFAANLYRDCQIDLRYYEAELKRICPDMSRHVEEDGASSDRSGVHPDDRLLETRYIDGQPSISRASFSSHPSSTDSHVGRSPTTRVTSDAVSSTLGSVSLGESLVRGYNHTVSTSWLRRQQKDRVKKDTEHRSAANGGVRTRLRQTLGGILGLNRKQYRKGQLHEKDGKDNHPASFHSIPDLQTLPNPENKCNVPIGTTLDGLRLNPRELSSSLPRQPELNQSKTGLTVEDELTPRQEARFAELENMRKKIKENGTEKQIRSWLEWNGMINEEVPSELGLPPYQIPTGMAKEDNVAVTPRDLSFDMFQELSQAEQDEWKGFVRDKRAELDAQRARVAYLEKYRIGVAL